MTVTALDGRVFEPPPVRPAWLRPLVILIVIALHAAALFFVSLKPRTFEPAGEVIVDIQPEAPPENPATPADEPKPPEQSAPPPAQDASPAPDRAAASNACYPASRRAAAAGRTTSAFHARDSSAAGGATSASPAGNTSTAGRRAASAARGTATPASPPETPPPPPAPVELAPPPPPPKPVTAPPPKPLPPACRSAETPAETGAEASPGDPTGGAGAISVRCCARSGVPGRCFDERAVERCGERFLAFGLYRGGERRHP